MPVRDFVGAFNAEFGLNKTASALRAALSNHRITCGRKAGERMMPCRLYSKEQVLFLKVNYAGRSVAELTDLYNAQFGTEMTKDQIKSFVSNRHIISGRTGYFPKGHVPWNTDTKGVMKPNSGNFQKGSVPKNTRPLWSERTDSKDGFVLIKVPEANPYTKAQTRFKHKHVWVWEQLHGPVPAGMVVAFKDGDKKNCEPDNLMLISRAELLYLNQHDYQGMPAELRETLVALAKLEVKLFSLTRDERTPAPKKARIPQAAPLPLSPEPAVMDPAVMKVFQMVCARLGRAAEL